MPNAFDGRETQQSQEQQQVVKRAWHGGVKGAERAATVGPKVTKSHQATNIEHRDTWTTVAIGRWSLVGGRWSLVGGQWSVVRSAVRALSSGVQFLDADKTIVNNFYFNLKIPN